MKRILVYSHDTYGLGNIRRMLEITRHLVDNDPEMSALLISGSPMLHAFRIPAQVDYVKLPCLARNAKGAYASKYLDLSLEESINLRANLIRAAVIDFKPDLILVDKKPFGVGDELAAALDSLPRRINRPRLVLLLRDILDNPETTAAIWRKNSYFEAISAYYDDVLVVGSPEIFDLRKEYDFPARAAAKVRFCGYIARSPGRSSRAQVRQRLSVAPDEPLVLVTPGGGEDGHALVSGYLDGLAGMPAGSVPRSLIVCGPEMSESHRSHVEKAAARYPAVIVESFSDDMMSLMDAADVVVSMGGYNTVCELLTLRKRAVVVPRVEPVEEQWIRAERMQAAGLLRAIHPAALSPAGLVNAVIEELACVRRGQKNLRMEKMDGLGRIEAAIQGHLAARRRHMDAIGRRGDTEHGRRTRQGQAEWIAQSASC